MFGLKALLLDRDGTLIRDKHYLADPAGVELLPGVGEALRACVAGGMRLFVVSNQSGVGRGMFSEQDVEACNQRLAELLAVHEAPLTAVRYCPHAPEERCDCRKPGLGMWRSLCRDYALDPACCAMIGDKIEDLAFGAGAGVALRVLTLTGKGRQTLETLGLSAVCPPLVRKTAEGPAPHLVVEDFRQLPQGLEQWSA